MIGLFEDGLCSLELFCNEGGLICDCLVSSCHLMLRSADNLFISHDRLMLKGLLLIHCFRISGVLFFFLGLSEIKALLTL